MNYKFGKQSANVCIEQICGRMRQFVRELPDDKSIDIEELAEQIMFCVLHELTEANLPFDPQRVVAVAKAMNFVCYQAIAINVPNPPRPPEIVWDDTLH
jgi:hypothetical protein